MDVGQWGAQIVADGVEQSGPQLVCRSELGGRLGGLGELPLPVRDRDLGGEGPEQPAVGGRQRAPVEREDEVLADLRFGVSLARFGGTFTDAGDHLPVVGDRSGASRVTARAENVSWTRSSSAGSACSPRSRLPARAESVSASALARAARTERFADRSTTRETSAATTRKTTSARTFSGSAMVKE